MYSLPLIGKTMLDNITRGKSIYTKWYTYPKFSFIYKKEGSIMSLITEIIIRIVLIVSMIDVIVFYIINKHPGAITMPFAIGIIVVTIISLTINILFCLNRRGIK
jgi:hypothetical protein